MSKILLSEFKYSLKKLYRNWAKPVLQITASLIIAFVIIIFWASVLGQRTDFFFLEKYHLIRGTIPPPQDIIIVAIDDEAYKKLEQSQNYPLPRNYLADALERIVEAVPKVIILDAAIPNERTINPEADNRIVAALKSGPTTIWSGSLPPNPDDPLTAINLPSDKRFREAVKMELPMAIYGHANLLAYIADDSAKTTDLYQMVPIARALQELGGYKIKSPGENDLIKFYGPPNTIDRVSIYELIAGDIATTQKRLKDKIVLIGYQSIHFAKATMNKDQFFVTGSTKPMYGVEVHANLIGNLIQGSWLRRLEANKERLILLAAVFLIAAFAMHTPGVLSLILIGGSSLLSLVVSYILFLNNFWLSGIGAFQIATLMIFILSAIYFFRRTQLYKRYIDKNYNFERAKDL